MYSFLQLRSAWIRQFIHPVPILDLKFFDFVEKLLTSHYYTGPMIQFSERSDNVNIPPLPHLLFPFYSKALFDRLPGIHVL